MIDIDTLNEWRTYVGHRDQVRGLAWLPDGETLISASADGTAKVWHTRRTAQAGEIVSELPAPSRQETSARPDWPSIPAAGAYGSRRSTACGMSIWQRRRPHGTSRR